MRVAFVSFNRERLPDPVIPLGLLYVQAAAARAGHQTALWDLAFADDPHAALRARLRAERPEVLAVGLRNIQRNDYGGIEDNLAAYTALLATIRAETEAPVIVGGAGFSVLPRQLMARLRPDYGIAGEGEQALPALLAALEGRRPLAAVPALYRWEEGALVVNPPAASFLTLDALAPPDRRTLDPGYYRHGGIDSLQTKRGCPLACSYCTYPTIEGRAHRLREPARVVDELERLQLDHPGVAHVFVVDSVFNLPTRHARAVCEALVARGNRLPWTCYVNPRGFEPRLAERMAAAGAVGVEVGADSGRDEVLARLNKGFDTAAIRRTHATLAAAGLKDCATFLLGTEGETEDDVRRTLEFVAELDPFCAIIMAWTPDAAALAPEAPGAAERRRLRARTLELLAEAAASAPRWVAPQLGLRFDDALFERLRRAGLRGPLWQHVDLAGATPPRSAADTASSTGRGGRAAPRGSPARGSGPCGAPRSGRPS